MLSPEICAWCHQRDTEGRDICGDRRKGKTVRVQKCVLFRTYQEVLPYKKTVS